MTTTTIDPHNCHVCHESLVAMDKVHGAGIPLNTGVVVVATTTRLFRGGSSFWHSYSESPYSILAVAGGMDDDALALVIMTLHILVVVGVYGNDENEWDFLGFDFRIGSGPFGPSWIR